jgi:hypothetical protein
MSLEATAAAVGTEVLNALIDRAKRMGWQQIDGRTCPECGAGPCLKRSIGLKVLFVGGERDQVVCQRHPHIIGDGDDRCMWSSDENFR